MYRRLGNYPEETGDSRGEEEVDLDAALEKNLLYSKASDAGDVSEKVLPDQCL